MTKEYEVGERYYLPVTVKSICPGYQYPIELRFIDSNLCDTDDTTSIADEPDLLLTAEDIATVINTERDEALEELKAKVAKLEAENASLKESLHEASEENLANDEALAQMSVKKAELKDENEKLKAELEQERKRTQVWKDSSEEHRQRAEELEGDVKRYEEDIADNEVKIQRLGQENDSLKADTLELKAQINAFRSSRSDPREVEELEKRVDMLEKLKFSHIKTIQGFTKRLRERDYMISALVRKGIESEEGGGEQ